MKKSTCFALTAILSILSCQFLSSCDKDNEPKIEVKQTKDLTAWAFVWNNTMKRDSANFDLAHKWSKIITGNQSNITIGTPSEYKQSYSYSFSLTSNQMVASPGDEIEIKYTPTGEENEAVFTIENGETYEATAENPSIKFNIPDVMPEKMIIQGEAEYTKDNVKYLRTGNIEILSLEKIMYENIKYGDMTIPSGASFEIPFSAGVEWKSSNPSIASVENSVVTGNTVGVVYISSKEHSFKVTVEAGTNVDGTFMEPCIDWGSNMEFVQNYMKGFTIESITTNGSETKLEYELKDLSSYSYTFTSDKLSSASLLLGTIDSEKTQAYIDSLYIDTTVVQDGIHLYLTKDGKTAVGVSEIAGYIYLLMYIPLDSVLNKENAIKRMVKIKKDTDLTPRFPSFLI